MPVEPVYLSMMGDVAGIVTGSGPFAKFIVLLLFVLSLWSWAVVVERWRRLRRADAQAVEFGERFKALKTSDLSVEGLRQWSHGHPGCVEARLFLAYADEWAPRWSESAGRDREAGQELLHRALTRAEEGAMEDLQQGLGWLATLSSVAPFLGLLGTVWGIMGSFLQLGRQGSASLDVVGPGIAEALITTAAGLAVAIPAVVAYNHFMGRLRRREVAAQRVSSELLDLPTARRLDAQGVG